MQFHYFLFPHRADQLEAKEDADERLHRVEDKNAWAREDTRDSQMQCSMFTGSRSISTPSRSPTRMDH